MTTITIPINSELLAFINEEIKDGQADSKANFVRGLILKYKENRVFEKLKEADLDIKNGRVYRGNLRSLISKI
jgi:Arc/MetJ-type ribon-helix-helix transcriptional regulator